MSSDDEEIVVGILTPSSEYEVTGFGSEGEAEEFIFHIEGNTNNAIETAGPFKE